MSTAIPKSSTVKDPEAVTAALRNYENGKPSSWEPDDYTVRHFLDRRERNQ